MPVFSPSEAQQLLNNLKAHGGSAKFVSHENAPRAKIGRRREMNKTEIECSRLLDSARIRGEILSWKFEAIKLHIGSGAYYTPDFLCLTNDKPLLIEVKGAHAWSRDKVRWKVAKEEWTWLFDFAYWQKINGVWHKA